MSADRPTVATFYSFKGGVGRSTLAANVAALLAQSEKTLLWDMDLEAPTLRFIDELTPSTATVGLMPAILSWQENGGTLPLDAASLSAFTEAIAPINGAKNLSLLPACGEDLSSLVDPYSKIDWAHLAESVGDAPSPFVQIIDAVLAACYTDGVRYVVIDSRTGMTDFGVALTALVSDMTFLVGGWGRQNTLGLSLMWGALGNAANSDLPARTSRGLGRLQRRLVASPLPALDAEKRAAFNDVWHDAFGIVPSEWHEIPESPTLRQRDQILALQPGVRGGELLKAYEAVARSVRDFAQTETPSALYPEDYAEAKNRSRDVRRGRGRIAQEKGETFEQRIAYLLRLLGYQTQSETLVDSNRIDIIAQKKLGIAQECYFIECKDTTAVKDHIDKLHGWLNDPEAKNQYKASGMVVARDFAPAARKSAQDKGILCFTPEDLEARLFDFAPYLSRLRKTFEESELARTYVGQFVKTDDERTRSQAPESAPRDAEPLLAEAMQWARGKGSRLWVLLGDYGTGKTAFTQRFAYELAKAHETDSSSVPAPLLINLRDYPNATTLKAVVDEHIDKTLGERGRGELILHLVARGRALLLLDSFDEMGLAAMGVSVDSQFRQLAAPTSDAELPQANRVLITCREEFFRDRVDVSRTASGRSDSLAPTGSQLESAANAFAAEIDTLEYFNREQIADFLRKKLGDTEAQRALEHLNRIHGAIDLASRPQLLDIILESLPELVSGKRAVNAGSLYMTYVNRWLAKYRASAAQLADDDKLRLLEGLAVLLWHRGAQPIHYRDLSAHLAQSPSFPPGLDAVRVDLEMRTAAFLTRSPDGFYRFSHRSFLEFFYARALYRTLIEPNEAEGDAALKTALSQGEMRDEVARFLADLWCSGEISKGNSVSLTSCRLPQSFKRLLSIQQHPVIAANVLLALRGWGSHESIASQSVDVHLARLQHMMPALDVGAKLAGIALEHQSLDQLPLAGADFSSAQLRGCDFASTQLAGAKFQKATLNECNILLATLDRANFTGASLISASITYSTARQAQFHHANLRNATLIDCDLNGASFTGSDLTLARLDAVAAPLLSDSEHSRASLLRGLIQPPANLRALRGRIPRGAGRNIKAIAFSSDGKYLATGSRGEGARLFDLSSGREIHHFKAAGSSVQAIAVSVSGKLLATGSDGNGARLFEIASGREIKHFESAGRDVETVAFSPDGKRLATGSWLVGTRVFEIDSGRKVQHFRAAGNIVKAIAFSENGAHLAIATLDQGAQVFETSSAREIRQLKTAESRAQTTAFSPDGKFLATGCAVEGARLFEIVSGQEIQHFRTAGSDVQAIVFSPDGTHLATGSADEGARLFETATGREIQYFKTAGRDVDAVAFSADGKYCATGGWGEGARLFEIASGREIQQFRATGSLVGAIDIASDGTCFATGSFGEGARSFDSASGLEIRHFKPAGDYVQAVAFSADGKYFAAGSWREGVQLVEIASGREIQRFQTARKSVVAIAFSADGKYLATRDVIDGARLLDVESGREIKHSKDGDLTSLGVELAPQDKCADLTLRIQSGVVVCADRASGEMLWEFAFEDSGYGPTNSVMLFADQAYIAHGPGGDLLLEYEEKLSEKEHEAALDLELIPRLHKAADVPWLRRKG